MGNILEKRIKRVDQLVASGVFPDYVYGYPSKRTYSLLEGNIDVAKLWEA